MKLLAIIPARGGSKRIPRKNIRNFLGKPIIAYPIAAAIELGRFSGVCVPTDDVEIQKIAEDNGASVPFLRSAENSDDVATTASVLCEVVEAYQQQGQSFDIICCIYPTAPFVTANLLAQSLQQLVDCELDSVFPVLKYGFPIQRAVKLNDGKVAMVQTEHLHTRSQDLEDHYHDAGQFYWIRTQALVREKKLWTNNTGAMELDPMSAHDIDTISDWKAAEFKYQLKQSTSGIDDAAPL